MKYQKTLATDGLKNVIANIGTGTDRVSKSFFAPDNFYSYDELAGIYMGWLGRRIVDLPPEEALKKGWEIFCPSWDPEKINLLNAYTSHVLNLQSELMTALKSARIFGGSVILAIVSPEYGNFSQELPAYLPKNSLLTLRTYDAWQCYPAAINFLDPLKKNYLNPINYTISAAGLQMPTYDIDAQGNRQATHIQGTLVDYTRVRRLDGLYLPWYLRQRNMYWGQSVLANIHEAIRNAKGVDASVVSLLFRASVPVLKVQDLADIVADDQASEAFLKRVNLMNYGLSNNNMAIIDSEEQLESFEPGAVTNLDDILERFYILCCASSGIPVTKLIGESARGLNATGEGDMNNYYDMLEDYQNAQIRPALMDMYKHWIIPSFFNELMPKDFEIVFPPLERVSPEKKQKNDDSFLQMTLNALGAGLIDKRVARREIQERKIFKNFNEEDVLRIETQEQENEVSLNEALDSVDESFKITE